MEDLTICKVCDENPIVPCGTKINHLQLLHKHIRAEHKLTIEQYYTQYYDKRDLLTKEPIKFKNLEFYFHTLFNTRKNLVKYFKDNSKDEENLIKCISLRKELKNLTVAPSTAECRTIIFPTPLLCQTIQIDYNKICERTGLVKRFDYNQTLKFSGSPLEILSDTREQKSLNFRCKTSITTLDVGDYTCKSHYKKIYFDRKSLSDFSGSLSKGYERVERECQRAADNGLYLIFGIECTIADIEAIPFTPFLKKTIKATPEFLFNRMRTLCEKFDNVQFLFCDGRKDLAEKIEKIFRLENNIGEVDLQYFVDKKEL